MNLTATELVELRNWAITRELKLREMKLEGLTEEYGVSINDKIETLRVLKVKIQRELKTRRSN